MNFKEQYKAAFSEIHASEDIVERLCEVKDMKDHTLKITKSKKKFMALLAAAIFAATSAVAVSAGALNGAFDNIRMYINGQEVSASDYVNGGKIQLGDNEEFTIELSNLADDVSGYDVSVYITNDIEDGVSTAKITVDSEESPEQSAGNSGNEVNSEAN